VDPKNSLDDRPVAESRLKDGLKTCHKIVESYRSMLEQGADDLTTGEVAESDHPNPPAPASSE
jgi:hypothetical protein